MGCSNSSRVKENDTGLKKDETKGSGSSSNLDTNDNANYIANSLKLKNILNNDSLANHYKVIDKIGNGSFGKVYKVLHIKTGQERALKVVNKAIIKYQDDEKQFLKEIEMLSQLDHPNIIKVYEYFVENNNYYVVQELCKGGELYEQIYQCDSFTEQTAAHIMFQILSAVYYLHSKNIVHRDLKPENIMLSSIDDDKNTEINIKLIDFGTANNTSSTLTQKVGTSYYIAPEVVRKKYNNKCDVWSCGVILFILLCGYPPYDGETDEEIMESVVKDEVSYNEQEWKNISKDAINFVKKLLTKDPNKRISSEQALKEKWLVETCSINNNNKKKDMINIATQIQQFQKFDSKQKLKNAILAFMVHQLATEEMTKELKDLFKRMDKSGDGRLSLQELIEGFREVMKSQGRENVISEEEITKRFNDIDIDHSKFIEIEEFITVTINEELLMTEKNLKTTFDYFDKDKSGCLDEAEITDLLQHRGNNVDIKLVKDLINVYDTNNDGVLSFEEFKNLIKAYNPNIKKKNEG